MLVLDSTTKSIVATMSGTANTTNPSFVTAYSDNTGTVFTEGSSDGALNGISSVTLVAAPASSTRRLIKTIYISNIDTAAVTVTISYNDNSTLRQIAKVTLQVGDTWSTDGTTDNTGSLKTTAGSVNLSNVTGTLTANGIVYASSTSVLTTGSALTFNGTNLGIGTSSPPAKLVVSNAGAAGYEVNPTGGIGGGATVATYNRSTSAYTSLTTYASTMTWYYGSTRAMDLDASGNLGIGVKTAYIEPGSPWENGFCESFNGTFRDNLLDGEIFYSLIEAQIIVGEWVKHYNHVRPHSALGYRPPAPQTQVPQLLQNQPMLLQ